MKYGLFGVNMGIWCDPQAAAKAATAAEQAGFESLWTGEHVVLPDPQVAPSPLPPEFPILDSAVSLTYLAACTEKVLLGTGIIILPQRNPLVLAKELASVDVVSGGRLLFGIGIGYLEPEFAALGIPFDQKGPRTIEYLEAMLAVWSQDAPAYQGSFVSFSGIQAHPQPVQRPSPPIVMGGHSAPAFRRAVEHAHGWYGFSLDVEATEGCVAGLREALGRYERPAELGELEISITPSVELDADSVRRFEDAGTHRLMPICLPGSEDELMAFIARLGSDIVAKL